MIMIFWSALLIILIQAEKEMKASVALVEKLRSARAIQKHRLVVSKAYKPREW